MEVIKKIKRIWIDALMVIFVSTPLWLPLLILLSISLGPRYNVTYKLTYTNGDTEVIKTHAATGVYVRISEEGCVSLHRKRKRCGCRDIQILKKEKLK